VPKLIANDTFWERYCYRLHMHEEEERKRDQMMRMSTCAYVIHHVLTSLVCVHVCVTVTVCPACSEGPWFRRPMRTDRTHPLTSRVAGVVLDAVCFDVVRRGV
jgi:hypothetical protein